MKIAILGAGFTGLASAWYLLQTKKNLSIDLFDCVGIGGGASGIAAGLFHPFSGLHAKLNRFGREGWSETCCLLNCASQELGKPVAEFTGLLRIALNAAQYADYSLCAK